MKGIAHHGFHQLHQTLRCAAILFDPVLQVLKEFRMGDRKTISLSHHPSQGLPQDDRDPRAQAPHQLEICSKPEASVQGYGENATSGRSPTNSPVRRQGDVATLTTRHDHDVLILNRMVHKRFEELTRMAVNDIYLPVKLLQVNCTMKSDFQLPKVVATS